MKTLDQRIEVDIPHECAAVDGVWYDLDMASDGATKPKIIASVRVLNTDTPPGPWVDPAVHFAPDVVDYLERYNWRQP